MTWRFRWHARRYGSMVMGAGILLSMLGCQADRPLNPSFPLTLEQAEIELAAMKQWPMKLLRPVVVVGGYADPGIATRAASSMARDIGGDRVLAVHLWACGSFDDARDHLINEIDKAFPSSDPQFTTEVDVIGGSMGGLAARYAAHWVEPADTLRPPRRRLRIARLFTISTPHLGARMADLPSPFDSKVTHMRRGSAFLDRLNAALPTESYEVYPYTRLGDLVVGEENTAPPGMKPWWVATPLLQFSHLNSMRDPRILADIARRLRGQRPFTTSPPADLPKP
jgi:hypothetical protein